MSMWDFRKVTENRKLEHAKATEKSFRESLEERLIKGFRTSFIGDLSQVEKFFGSLWGHGKHPRDCTERELAWREMYEQCREAILNNGNDQLRKFLAELQRYTVTYNGFKLNMKVTQEKDTNRNGNEQENV